MGVSRGFVRIHLLTLLIWMILASITLGLAVNSRTHKVWFEFNTSRISYAPNDPGSLYFEVKQYEVLSYGSIHPIAFQQRDRTFRIPMSELADSQLQSEVRALLSKGCCGMRVSSPEGVKASAPAISAMLRHREPNSIYNSELDWASDLLATVCMLGIAFILFGVVSEVLMRMNAPAHEKSTIDACAA